MKEAQAAASIVRDTFERILREQMQDIPLLNHSLQVETLGFQLYQGRVIGIVITPWLMNLVMLPGEEDDWSGYELGKKLPYKFPSRIYKFMVNEIDGIGKCQTYSLFSPMHEFSNQDHAVSAAESFLETLMVERSLSEEERVDEELLGRILRGEETPEIDLDDFDEIKPAEMSADDSVLSSRPERGVKEVLSRRDLLRGAVMKES